MAISPGGSASAAAGCRARTPAGRIGATIASSPRAAANLNTVQVRKRGTGCNLGAQAPHAHIELHSSFLSVPLIKRFMYGSKNRVNRSRPGFTQRLERGLEQQQRLRHLAREVLVMGIEIGRAS